MGPAPCLGYHGQVRGEVPTCNSGGVSCVGVKGECSLLCVGVMGGV